MNTPLTNNRTVVSCFSYSRTRAFSLNTNKKIQSLFVGDKIFIQVVKDLFFNCATLIKNMKYKKNSKNDNTFLYHQQNESIQLIDRYRIETIVAIVKYKSTRKS